MERPPNMWEHLSGKAHAAGFHGSGGWPMQMKPCSLEPPWAPYDLRGLSHWEGFFNGWNYPWEGSWWKRLLFPPAPLFLPGETILLPEVPLIQSDELAHIVIEKFPEDESTIALSEVFLRSLANLTAPVSFEIVGIGSQPIMDIAKGTELIQSGQSDRMSEAIAGWTKPYVKTQFVTHESDAKQVIHQLQAQYPNSAVLWTDRNESLEEDGIISSDVFAADGYAGTLRLSGPYCFSLRQFTRLDPDPLGVVLAAMDHLEKREWAVLQILFQPATERWSKSFGDAMSNPYDQGRSWFPEVSDRIFNDKFSSPLFAVTIRIAARSGEVYRHMQGWAEQFTNPPQQFEYLLEDDEASFLGEALSCRATFRPGMLLNVGELASLVHLPGKSVVSDRLKRVKTRTRPAAEAPAMAGSVLLGENVHQGVIKPARISTDLRSRHCYVAGASGTGKSTLLLNMILQDIRNGEGVGVLDPHGDLIHDVLRHIPEERIEDVVLFDPVDDQWPVALNILEARDETERERIVAETVMSLERYFPASWGPRLERILTFTLYTVLDAIPGATLADVERMLTDPKFREEVIIKTKDPRFVEFWNKQFVFLPKNAVDPVLNKLSVFLLNKTVRNIICQRHSAIDFDHILNDRKIFLANLSTGRLTEKIAGTLGSFLVTKIVNAAFRRASMPEDERKPWYLYIDEFQAFMNLSVGFERILAEARKYRLVLAGLANQYVGQLTPAVRQALFGNVGTLVVFRLGIDDANVVSRELGAFSTDEVLNLGVGQAFVRSGISADAYNLSTPPKPSPPTDDPTWRIKDITRMRYARPVVDVEAEIGGLVSSDRMPHDDALPYSEPEDPMEEDLVM